MKKNILTIFTAVLTLTSHIQATPLEALRTAQKQITDGETKIADSIKQIKKAYIKTEDEVVDEIGRQVNTISGQYDQIKKIYTIADDVRNTLPASIAVLTATVALAPVAAVVTAMVPIFGDCPELIKGIRDTVGNILDTLKNVKNTMEPANAKLNPLADPNEVFYTLTKAQLLMKKGTIILTMITNKIEKIVEHAIATKNPTAQAPSAGNRIVIKKDVDNKVTNNN